jgi:hypothetical protein
MTTTTSELEKMKRRHDREMRKAGFRKMTRAERIAAGEVLSAEKKRELEQIRKDLCLDEHLFSERWVNETVTFGLLEMYREKGNGPTVTEVEGQRYYRLADVNAWWATITASVRDIPSVDLGSWTDKPKRARN